MKALRRIGTAILACLWLLVLPFAALSFMAERTLLEPAFVRTETQRAPLADAGITFALENLPSDMAEYRDVLDVALRQQAPALQEQLAGLMAHVHLYLVGQTDTVAFRLELADIRKVLHETLRRHRPAALEAQLRELPAAERARAIADYEQQVDELIGEVPLQEMLTLDKLPAEARSIVERCREQIRALPRISSPSLLVLVVVALGIAWLSSPFRAGTLVVVGGALVWALKSLLAVLAEELLPRSLPPVPAAAALQAWIVELPVRLLAPLDLLAAGLGIMGFGLFVYGFLRRRHTKSVAPATAAIAAPPPPAAPARPKSRRPWLIAIVLAIVLAGLAIWPGGAIQRITSYRALAAGRVALAANDWPEALAQFERAVQARPGNAAIRRAAEDAGIAWLRTLDPQILPLGPEERWVFFLNEPRPALRRLLLPELAEQHELFIAANLDQVRTNIEESFARAEALARAGDFAAAEKQVDATRPFAAAYEGYEILLASHADAMDSGRYQHALRLSTSGDIAGARAEADRLKDSRVLTPEELEMLNYRIDVQAWELAVEAAFMQAETDGISAALARLVELEFVAEDLQRRPAHARMAPPRASDSAGALVDVLEILRWELRARSGATYIPKLVAALKQGDLPAAETLLKEYCLLARLPEETSATALTRERDPVRFAELLAGLRFQGVTAVQIWEHQRAMLSSSPAFGRELGKAYFAAAEEAAGNGRYTLALYLLQRAAEESGETPPQLAKVLSHIAGEYGFTVHLPLTVMPLEPGSAAFSAADLARITQQARAALQAVLSAQPGGWIKVSDSQNPGKSDITLRTTVHGISEERDLLSNPHGVRLTFPDGATTNYNYSLNSHRRNHVARISTVVELEGQSLGAAEWSANLRYAAFQVSGRMQPGSRIPNIPTPQYLPSTVIAEQLARDLAAKIRAQKPLLLHRLAEASFTRLKNALGAEGAPAEIEAEAAWGYVALWQSIGVRVPDYHERENAMRRLIGLPQHALHVKVPARAQPASGLPFENSLGMRFLAVPNTKVLFSVWETRVGDYAKFIAATRHASDSAGLTWGNDGLKNDIARGRAGRWDKPYMQQTPDHPVVCVRLDDAKAFCRWLTETDRAAGLIDAHQEYRLPTRAEWEAVNQPALAWPPAAGAGNFAGTDFLHYYTEWPFIQGYDDGYTNTAPVGSFSANPHGIHDLEGNVAELVHDDSANNGVTAMGSMWVSNKPFDPSNFRKDISYSINGFRTVLADTVKP